MTPATSLADRLVCIPRAWLPSTAFDYASLARLVEERLAR